MFHKGQRAIYKNTVEMVEDVKGHQVTLSNLAQPVFDWELSRPEEPFIEMVDTFNEEKFAIQRQIRQEREEFFNKRMDTFELKGHSHRNLEDRLSLSFILMAEIPPVDPLNPDAPQAITHNDSYVCDSCGSPLNFNIEGATIQVANTPCEGAGFLRLLLNVPSGVIVYSDDLRPLVGVDGCRFDINTPFGCKEESRYFERLGQVFIHAGNTDPILMRKSKDQNIFELSHKKGNKKERIGVISTNLWWVSFMDLLEAEHRNKALGEQVKWQGQFSVVPGVYAFDVDLTEFHQKKSSVNIHWVGPPEPLKRITPLEVTPEMLCGRNTENPYKALSEQRNVHQDWSRYYATYKNTAPVPSPKDQGDCWKKLSGYTSNPLRLASASPEWFEAGLYLLWAVLCYDAPKTAFQRVETYHKAKKYLASVTYPKELPEDLKEFLNWFNDSENTLKWVQRHTPKASRGFKGE